MIDCSVKKKTYFHDSRRFFPILTKNGEIPTEQFLSACQGVADFVGFLGIAFEPVKRDIAQNVQKVKQKFDLNKENLKYLQNLIDSDLSENNGKLGNATEGLLWLKRGLEFMLHMLKLLVNNYRLAPSEKNCDVENIGKILQDSYEHSLKRHHNFISKQLFKVIIYAAPYRRDLLKAMAYGNDGMEEICINHIADLLENFELCVHALVNYYYKKNLETRPS